MPQHKSAKKRVKTSAAANARNRQYRARMRTMVKKVLTATEKEPTEVLLRATTSLLDKMVNKGILKRNTAARRKALIARRTNALA